MTVEVFWGNEPRVRSEVQFLKQLKADLASRGMSAIVLANFFTYRSSRQIDFLVVSDSHVCHVELKNYPDQLVGHTNGPWSSRGTDGSLEVIDRQNPYTQAQECKLALSDDMHSLAAQDSSIPAPSQGRFYTQFDSVVCIFPRLADGSQVPSDYKVKTMGYVDFLTFLTRPGAHPQWNRDHWATFVRMLALANGATAHQKLAANTAQRMVRDYSRRFKEFYGSRLHELVPLPLNIDESTISSTQFAGQLHEARHVQLIGPSGCGKSHLVKHTALAMQDNGDLVAVLIEAGMYEGRLSPLLNRSIGRFSANSTEELLQAAAINGQEVLLVVDGFNECPDSLQERLLGDLSAFCLRVPALTLLTSQAAVPLPEALASKTISAGTLSEADRKTVLDSYGSPDILQLCEPFSTAYELSIASECVAELDGAAIRANLFDAFIRKRLSKTPSPAYVREALRRLALVMAERLTPWLPIDEVWRRLGQFLAERSAPSNMIDEVLNCSITSTQQGKFSFTHELLGRFLAAEALLLRHHQPQELLNELKKPRHHDLPQFVVALETDPKRVGQLLNDLAEGHLFSEALLGSFGPVADRVIRSTVLKLLGRITSSLKDTIFTVHKGYEVRISGGHVVSDAEHALLAAVGALMIRGHFTEQVVALLDATDAACCRSADLQASTGGRPSASTMVSAILAGPMAAGPKVAARIVLEACEQAHLDSRFRRHQNVPHVSEQQLPALLAEANPQSHGRLLLACSLLNFPVSLDAAALGPRILQLCWDSGAYHVQIKGLMTVQHFALVTSEHPLRNEIVAVLDSFDATNIDIMLSTMVVDVMNSYGMIESPVEAGQVTSEISGVLRGELTSEKCERAYGIVSSQFEDIVGEAYSTAIQALDPKQRTDLFTRAALGAPPHGFSNDWLLRRLIDLADRRTLPAFERWATRLEKDTPFIQGVGSCYALAMEGSALFLDTPPQFKDCRSLDEEAWQCYGAIVFWLHRPALSEDDVAEHCAPLLRKLTTDLAPAAADALYWFSQPGLAFGANGKSILWKIVGAFQEELRDILEWSLEHCDLLTSIFGHRGQESPLHGRGGLAEYLIDTLGYVGNAGTTELLHTYVDDPVLGSVAIKSIRRATERRL